jgi:hypothetical protein
VPDCCEAVDNDRRGCGGDPETARDVAGTQRAVRNEMLHCVEVPPVHGKLLTDLSFERGGELQNFSQESTRFADFDSWWIDNRH